MESRGRARESGRLDNPDPTISWKSRVPPPSSSQHTNPHESAGGVCHDIPDADSPSSVVTGGFRDRGRTREIRGVDQNTTVNRALWALAEEMKAIKTAG